MTEFGEITPDQCMAETPDGFIERIKKEEGPDRLFYVPDLIRVYNQRTGEAYEGLFELDPETGAAVEESAIIDQATRLGTRVIVCAGAKIFNAVIYGEAIIEERATVCSKATIFSRALVRKRALIGNHCAVGVEATIGGRAKLRRGAAVEAGAIVPYEAILPENSFYPKERFS